MNKAISLSKFLALFVATSLPVIADITPKDTSAPNQYYFTSANYFASGGTTNAVVTVRFIPGSRTWNGSINYSATEGTAKATQDFTAISGTLNFSGTSYGYITVPVNCTSSNQQSTIQLRLTPNAADPNAIISRSNATLTINLPPPPNLKIDFDTNGAVILSWLDDGSEVFVEKQTPPGTNWIALPATYAEGETRWSLDFPTEERAFYRSRRTQ